jgi:two-component system chemotaxis response regulator CheB
MCAGSSKEPKFIVVIGTSAGGMNALSELVAQFTTDMDIAVFIVMHLSRTSISDFLVHRLQPFTTLHCELALEDGPIQVGHIYVGAPNTHLLVKKNRVLLGHGPAENRWRPSIDVLFRSAAVSYNSKAIGIILTGSLDDGTTGMAAIQRCGGCTIVQDPNEAEYPDMPISVLNTMEVDHCIPLGLMREAITAILLTEPAPTEVPADVIIESEIAERVVVNYDHVKEIGEKSIYACPDCGGGLWNICKETGKPGRYRCHIGHSYSEKDLEVKQAEALESTLWTALRIMEERRTLLKKMEHDHEKKGFFSVAANFKTKGEDLQFHVDRMKEILLSTQRSL